MYDFKRNLREKSDSFKLIILLDQDDIQDETFHSWHSPLNVLGAEALGRLVVLDLVCEWHLDPDHLAGVRPQGADHAPLIITAVTVDALVIAETGAQDLPEARRLAEVVRGPGGLVILIAAVQDTRRPRGVQPRTRP